MRAHSAKQKPLPLQPSLCILLGPLKQMKEVRVGQAVYGHETLSHKLHLLLTVHQNSLCNRRGIGVIQLVKTIPNELQSKHTAPGHRSI